VVKLQNHHPDNERYPDWTIEVSPAFHVYYWRKWQRSRATGENYYILSNEIFCLNHRLQEMRRELDLKEQEKTDN
jgi:hypothetical protein